MIDSESETIVRRRHCQIGRVVLQRGAEVGPALHHATQVVAQGSQIVHHRRGVARTDP